MREWLRTAYDLIAEDLRRADEATREISRSESALVGEVCRQVLAGGGKKIRPGLLLLAARAAGGPIDPTAPRLAAGIEIVHVASLLHDDAVDGSRMRRGRPTANALWGDKVPVFVADFLFASLYAHLATTENVSLLRVVATAVIRMCEAEVLQATTTGDTAITESQYMTIINGKTAALMAAACRAGALLGGADNERADARERYGRAFGTAFQMTDDLLDLTGAVTDVGKPLGADLRAGRYTLPIIAMRSRLQPDEHDAFVRRIAAWADLSEADVRTIAERAEQVGAMEHTRTAVRAMIAEAVDALSALDPSPAHAALEGLAVGLASRRA